MKQSWFRGLFDRKRKPKTIRRPVSHRFRPSLEALEDRMVPAVLTVNSAFDNLAGGSTLTLREAISLVNHAGDADAALGRPLESIEQDQIVGAFGDNDTIEFHVALTTRTIALDGLFLGQLPAISADLTITGLGADLLAIDAQNSSRIFEIADGTTVRISGLTLTRGSASDAGGAIFNAGTLTVTHSTLSGNRADLGGGIFNRGTLTVTQSTLSGNRVANEGGGVFNSGSGRLKVTQSTLSDNEASLAGGAISNSATLTVTNSTLSGNSASIGGAIRNSAAAEDIVESVVSNSTITGNRATAIGGGGGIHDLGARTTLHNTIVAGNVRGNEGDDLPDDLRGSVRPTSSHNLIGNVGSSGGLSHAVNGNIVGNGGAGVIDINTVLDTALADNGGPTLTHALVAGSPAINAGDNNLIPAGVTTDQRGAGFPRIAGGTVDIGAFEVQNQPPVIAVPGAQTAFEDMDLALSGIRVGDVDNPSLTVRLSVSHGTLTLGTITGLTVTGNGSATVTLAGSIADLNAALASLVYRGALNFGGDDLLSITASDGSLSTNGSVAIHVTSVAEQTEILAAQVDALVAAAVLTSGQGESLNLNLKDNNGDAGKVQAFLNEVEALFQGGILTQAQAEALLGPGNVLLLGVTRR